METFGWEEVLVRPFHSAFFAAQRILRWKIHFLVDPRAGEMGMNCEGVKRTGKNPVLPAGQEDRPSRMGRTAAVPSAPLRRMASRIYKRKESKS